MSRSQATRRSILGGLAAMAAAGSAQARPREDADAAGSLWQGIALQDAAGRGFQIGDGGKPLTLLTLWASWCPACMGEMSSLASMAAALDSRSIDVVLVSHPEFFARDQQVARARALPFRLATPSAANAPGVIEAAMLDSGGTYVVPRSLVFRGRRGGAVLNHLGAMSWSAPATLAQLRGWMG